MKAKFNIIVGNKYFTIFLTELQQKNNPNIFIRNTFKESTKIPIFFYLFPVINIPRIRFPETFT